MNGNPELVDPEMMAAPVPISWPEEVAACSSIMKWGEYILIPGMCKPAYDYRMHQMLVFVDFNIQIILKP